jgi:hypothetical protein
VSFVAKMRIALSSRDCSSTCDGSLCGHAFLIYQSPCIASFLLLSMLVTGTVPLDCVI